MHVEVETRVDIHKQEKHKKVFFFSFKGEKDKCNHLHQFKNMLTLKQRQITKQTKIKSIAAVGAYMHNLWSTAGIIM